MAMAFRSHRPFGGVMMSVVVKAIIDAEATEDSVLAELIDDFTNRVHAGLPIDVETYAKAYPEHADRLRHLLPAVQALAKLESPSRSDQAAPASPDRVLGLEAKTLGDY